jgi:hypothetical protein
MYSTPLLTLDDKKKMVSAVTDDDIMEIIKQTKARM